MLNVQELLIRFLDARMINIKDKSQCCGCESCVQACPKQCINFTQDDEGFFYPEVNADTCIQCGLCERVCPVLHPYDEHKPQEVLAAFNKDEEVRMASSSGGVFTLLAEKIIKQGGVVFGVRFDDQWQAVFDYAETLEALAVFQGSKYIQARVGNCFTLCKQLLDQGRLVLFSGTPCQIAGLNRFLRKKYSNLITIDIICHGVPSPQVWKLYLDEIVKGGNSAIHNISFRDKHNGWKQYCFTMDYDEQGKSTSLSSTYNQNPYMRAFLWDIILRPSCYACKAKCGKSYADYTIGDFWGIQFIKSEMDDDKGTSVVMIHSKKGKDYFPYSDSVFSVVRYEEVCKYNPAVIESAKIPHNRKIFFDKIYSCSSFTQLIAQMLRPTLFDVLKKYKHSLKILKK